MIHLIHDWKAVSVQQLYWEHYRGWRMPSRIGPDEPFTEVLWRCEKEGCRAVQTSTLDGHWTLEEIS